MLSTFNTEMPPLQIGDKVAKIPIVQGGMGVGISLSGLASAVANEGGIGVIAANAIGMLEPDYYKNGKEANIRALRKEIQKAKRLTDGVIGVNIMVAVNDFHKLLQISIEEKVDILFLGAGLPLRGIPIKEINQAGVKVAPIVSSARAVKLIFKYWQKNYSTVPDAVVVEGPKAGGHLGFKESEIHDPKFALENLIPSVVEEVKNFERESNKKIPVIGAGGIYNGADIYKLLKLGANAIQMGTRFVATNECDADLNFKKTYLNCKEKDIIIIKSPVGLPGRAIKNDFLNRVYSNESIKFRCPWRCLESCNAKMAKYCISEVLDNARKGKLDNGFAFAGANAYRVNEIVPVKTLIEKIKSEYIEVAENSTVKIRQEFEEIFRKLGLLRDQYLNTAKDSMRNFKKEIGEILGKKAQAFREECKCELAKLESIKKEYSLQFSKIHELKDQLSQYFDTTFLKMPTPSISAQ